MEEWIVGLMSQISGGFGYIAVLALIAIENIFPPIPSEVILTFGGFLTTIPDTAMTIWGVIICATIGSVLGALVLYAVGRWLNPERLERWLDGKVGKILRLKKSDVSKATQWFSKKGVATVFFCRFIPIVRSLISIPAGIAKMDMGVFLIFTTIGTLIWNIVLVYLGAIMGESRTIIIDFISTYSHVVLVAIIIIFIICATIFYKKRSKSE